jgi:glycosyltransferase involved in cell wall biosynthesis
MIINNPLVSICIPTYEMNGIGSSFLQKGLDSILRQTYKNIEVVISDHSKDDEIQSIALNYANKLNIQYIRNTENRGSSSSNINNAVKKSSGLITKILFQDDWLLDEYSIEYHINSFTISNKIWSISACAHSNDGETIIDEHQPNFNDNILFYNTLSSPSTLLLYKEFYENFDTNLLWYMDTDVYFRLYKKYGYPYLFSKICVINRRHPNQITNTLVNNDLIRSEQQYLLKKYANNK